MPLFDFDCRACGARFEDLVPAGAAAACPACGSADTARAWTPVAPPLRIGLRGEAARRSDATRSSREERRQEGFAAQRERRRQQGDG